MRIRVRIGIWIGISRAIISRVNRSVCYRWLIHRSIHLILCLIGNLRILTLYLCLCLRQGLLGGDQLLMSGNEVLLGGTERTVHRIYLVLQCGELGSSRRSSATGNSYQEQKQDQ